jgi:hypothetical protein
VIIDRWFWYVGALVMLTMAMLMLIFSDGSAFLSASFVGLSTLLYFLFVKNDVTDVSCIKELSLLAAIYALISIGIGS